MTALVQKKSAGSAVGTAVTVTLDSPPTVGNLLVAVHFTRGTTATRPAGWAQDLLVNNATNADQFQVCSRVVQSGDGSSYTFGSTPTEDTNGITLYEFSPSGGRQWPSAPLDVTASTGETAGVETLSSGTTATRAVADSVSVAGLGLRGTATTPTANNSFLSPTDNAVSATPNEATALSTYRIETATGTSQTQFSWTNVATVIAGMAVYKTEAAAGGTTGRLVAGSLVSGMLIRN